MGRIDINLKIAKEATEIKLNDSIGTLTIESALREAKRNFNRAQGLHEIIKAVIGEDDN